MKSRKPFHILIILLFCLVLFSCNLEAAEKYKITITYSDGSAGIMCIESAKMSKADIKKYIQKVTFTTDDETTDITNEINIERQDNQWVVSYTTKEKVLLFFSKDKTIYETIKFRELSSLNIVYPDGSGKYLRINNESVQKNDLSRLKIQAVFAGKTEDVTGLCKISLTAVKNRIQVTLTYRNQTKTNHYTLNTDTLSSLSVKKTGLVPDYPTPSDNDIKSNVKVTAVYSSKNEVIIASSNYSIQKDTSNGTITFKYGSKEATIEYDEFTGLEAVKTGLISDYPVSSADDIKSSVILYAVYSNKKKVDITDRITIGSTKSSDIVATSLTDDTVNFSYGNKNTSVKLDKLSEIALDSLDGYKIEIADINKLDTEKLRKRLLAIASYSNGQQKIITDKIIITAEDYSSVSIKYGPVEVDTEGVISIAKVKSDSLTAILFFLSTAAVFIVIILVNRIQKNEQNFIEEKDKSSFNG